MTGGVPRKRWGHVPGFGNLGWPIAEKELRGLIRRQRFFWLQFLYLVVLASGICLFVAGAYESSMSPEHMSQNLFWIFFTVQTALVYVIFPAFAATAISGERSEQSFDLLLTTDLRPYEIVWGKFLGIVGNSFYFVLATVPLLATCILFGGIALGDALENYALLMVQIVMITIYGLLVSAASPSNVRSIIGTYLVAGLLGFASTVAVGEVLQSGGASLSLVESFLVGAPPGLGPGLLVGLGLLLVVVFASCFLGAVQRLSGADSSGAFGFRLLILGTVVVGGGLLLWLYAQAVQLGQLRSGGPRVGVLLGLSTTLGLLATSFLPLVAADRVEVPLRTVRQARCHPRRARALWLFLPGGVRGILFAWLTLLLLAALLVNLLLASPGVRLMTHQSQFGDAEGQLMTSWLMGCVAIASYCGAAFLMSCLGVRGVLNWGFLMGFVVLINLYPIVYLVSDQPVHFWHLRPLSVAITLAALWDVREFGGHESVLNLARACLIWHALVALVGLGVGLMALRRRRVPAFRIARRATGPHATGLGAPLVVMIVVCTSLAGCAWPRLVYVSPQQRAAERYQEGLVLEAAGQADLARASYRRAIDQQAEHAQAWRGIVRTTVDRERAALRAEIAAWEARDTRAALPSLLVGLVETGAARSAAWQRCWQQAPSDDSVVLRPHELGLANLAEWRDHAQLLTTFAPRTPELEFRTAWLHERLHMSTSGAAALAPAEAALLACAASFERGDRASALVHLPKATDRPQARVLEARIRLQHGDSAAAALALGRLAGSPEETGARALIDAELTLRSGATTRALVQLRDIVRGSTAPVLQGSLDPSDRVTAALTLHRHPDALPSEAVVALTEAIDWAPSPADLDRLETALVSRGAVQPLVALLGRKLDGAAAGTEREAWASAQAFLRAAPPATADLLSRHGAWVAGLLPSGSTRAALRALPVAERAAVLPLWLVHPIAELRLMAVVDIREDHPDLWPQVSEACGRDPDARVRAAWITLAARQGDPLARQAIELGRGDADPYVREVAERAARSRD